MSSEQPGHDPESGEEQKTPPTLVGVCFGAGSAFLSVAMITLLGPNPPSTLAFAILGLWVLAIGYLATCEKTANTEATV